MNVAMTLLCVNSMLEVLSKTKLCQGARRVLRLMKRRVGQVQVRDALKLSMACARWTKLKKLLQVMHTQGYKTKYCVVHNSSVKWDVLNGEILRGRGDDEHG
ncbi:hypothetical protein YC2023_083089 [Brassica napus]|uniref:(rape) hypothetical protein n=1 Tax=Brassica napus TaxID=3708 RepID=A0A816LZN6_BRANA|nr:unnamed protein product [Brassica napus]